MNKEQLDFAVKFGLELVSSDKVTITGKDVDGIFLLREILYKIQVGELVIVPPKQEVKE